MTKRNLVIYPTLIIAGALLATTFQNCSPANMQQIATESLSKETATLPVDQQPVEINPENPDSQSQTTTTQSGRAPGSTEGEGPLPNLNPIQSSVLNAGGWELIAMSIDGEEKVVPEIDPIAMDIRLVGVNDLEKAKKLTQNRVQVLFYVTLHQVCTPIVGNYLGITEEGVSDLAGSPLDLQGKGFKQETDSEYLASENCTADSENENRRNASHEVSVITKHRPDHKILTFERRGQNLVVIHANTELTFAPLDNQ